MKNYFLKDLQPGELKTIGERIQWIRLKHGLSQNEFAKTLMYSSGVTLSQWERGRCKPPLEAICVIAKTYGVSADWLLGLSKKMKLEAAENETR